MVSQGRTLGGQAVGLVSLRAIARVGPVWGVELAQDKVLQTVELAIHDIMSGMLTV
jgi:hypothetical protein